VPFPSLRSDATAQPPQRDDALAELLRDRRPRNSSWSYPYRAALFRSILVPHARTPGGACRGAKRSRELGEAPRCARRNSALHGR
jgi:hypothetical protein